jgi:hypothetical protein
MSAVPANRIDPITVEVIGSALSSIVEEMGEALVRASFRQTSRSAATAQPRCLTGTGRPYARPSTFQCTSAASSGSFPRS